MRSVENARKPQIWPVSLSQNSTKIRKINKLQPLSDQFWRWSKYISMQNVRSFAQRVLQDKSACKRSDYSHHAFSSKCPETSPDGRTDGHAAKRSRLVGWTNGPMYRWKAVISGFRQMDGRTDGVTDGQPENIMPLAPKGWGIKKPILWSV